MFRRTQGYLDLIGSRIRQYRIVELLGTGGMGEVWVAHDETLQRKVALKAIRKERRPNPQFRARFLREARILSQLDHPNICRIYDYLEEPQQDFLVLELIEGRSLQACMREGEGIDRAEAMRIGETIARVLVTAHQAGVVHRDLKPDNVMLTPQGEIKVLDFGLARPVSDPSAAGSGSPATPSTHSGPEAAGDATTIVHGIDVSSEAVTKPGDQASTAALATELGSIVGTPLFMSPEQANGEPVSPASDMYSFGLLLQTLFTGEYPYPRGLDLGELMQRVRRAETLPINGVDPHLAQLVGRLKAAAPGARPTSNEAARRLRWIRNKPKRRLRNLAIAGAAVVVVLASLKYALDLTRARDLADQRRIQAEALIEFMLGDLRTKLEPVGRLEILDDVGEKALEYFASVPEGELSDDELFRRSTALSQIGQVRLGQGDLAASLPPFEESLALAAALVDRRPENREYRLGLGAARFWLGYVALRQGDLDRALEAFRSYRDLARGMVEQSPNDPELKLELGYSHSNIGRVLEARGDLEGALEQYRDCLAIETELSAADPEDHDLRYSIGDSLTAIGTVLVDMGDPRSALESYRANLELKRALLEAEPDNSTWRYSLCIGHNLVAHVLEGTGDLEASLGHYHAAIDDARRLVTLDSTNATWRRELAVNLHARGRVRALQGDVDLALEDLRASAALLKSLLDEAGANLLARTDLAGLLNDLGRVEARRGELGTADELAKRALALCREVLEQDPQDRHAARLGSGALELSGVIRDLHGDTDGARRDWQASLDLIAPVARSSSDRRFLIPWAVALLRLDRPNDARDLVRRIESMGYRSESLRELCELKGLSIGGLS